MLFTIRTILTIRLHAGGVSMFNEWLKENSVRNIDFSSPLFPPDNDRCFWEGKDDAEIIRQAETHLGYTWPAPLATDYMAFRTEGNRAKQETPHFSRRHALQALLLGELLEYKQRFFLDNLCGNIQSMMHILLKDTF